MAVWLLLLCVCLADAYDETRTYSEPFQGNSRAYLQIKWISQEMTSGRRNVTVRYAAFDDAVAVWKVNGGITTDIDSDYDVSQLSYYHDSYTESSTVRTTSILLPRPGTVTIDRLEVRLFLDVVEVFLYINLPDLEDGQSRVEELPRYSFSMDHAEHIQYSTIAPLKILTKFTSDNLDNYRWLRTRAKFITLDKSVTPPAVETKTSRQDQDFIRISAPTEEEVPYHLRGDLSNPNIKLRLIKMPQTSSEFWGLLKIKTGFMMKEDCNFFGGIRITRTAFLRSPEHGDFFGANTVVIDSPVQPFGSGGHYDVVVSALGGAQKDWYGEEEDEYPRIAVFKDNQETNGTERIDILRLFQRETVIRFRNLISVDSGTYEVRATYQNGSDVKSFFIRVD